MFTKIIYGLDDIPYFPLHAQIPKREIIDVEYEDLSDELDDSDTTNKPKQICMSNNNIENKFK